MKKPFLIGTSLFMVVLIAFVYFSQPVQAKADQPTLDYQTTNSSLSEVKAMITGMEAAVIPLVFIVIGFIALTYCTLRNVNVPLQYSSNTSFIDKCSELGHYVFDNATEEIKNVLYSVATFVASGQITDPNRISSTLPFLLTSVGRFFAAFGAWLGSSFINVVNTRTQGLLNLFTGAPAFSGTTYNYYEQLIGITQDSPYPIADCLGSPYYTGGYPSYSWFRFFYVTSVLSDYYIAFNGTTNIAFYTFDAEAQTYNIVSNQDIYGYMFNVKTRNGTDQYSAPQFATDWSDPQLTNISNALGVLGNHVDFGYWLPYLLSLGAIAVINVSSFTSEIGVADAVIINRDVITPWSDQVYTPTDDQTEVDIDDIANKLGEGATIGSLAALIALLTQDKALTLGTAVTDVQTINSAGDYNFPSMDNIWKYPQYFFDMLHGWGSFVKGCLNAVTVGEGGLSWLFYGGFVLLICGGIIGKILLG